MNKKNINPSTALQDSSVDFAPAAPGLRLGGKQISTSAATTALGGKFLITAATVEAHANLEALIITAVPFQQICALGTLELDFASTAIAPEALDLMYDKYPKEIRAVVDSYSSQPEPQTAAVRRRLTLIAFGSTCRDFAQVFSRDEHPSANYGIASDSESTIAEYQRQEQAQAQDAQRARAAHNARIDNQTGVTHWI